MTDASANSESIRKKSLDPKQSTQDPHNISLLTNTKDFICYNQGEYAQYNFLVSLRHQKLKKARSKDDIKAKLDSLNKFVFSQADAVFTKNFEIIKKFFSERDKELPRVCVKCHDDKKQIVDVFRDRQAYINKPYHISDNTGFNEVYKTGEAYLNNDIPRTAMKGLYKNPRLHIGAAKNYIVSKSFSPQGPDTTWNNCWNPTIEAGTETPSPAESCYKSTLIVPMTLLNNELSDEFKVAFKIDKKQVDLVDEKPRAIWGYLCLDHVERDYFKKDMDAALGYIFADMLSLYLITKLTYTEYSKTYISKKKEVEDVKVY